MSELPLFFGPTGGLGPVGPTGSEPTGPIRIRRPEELPGFVDLSPLLWKKKLNPPIPRKLINILKKNGVLTLRQLCALRSDEIRKMKGVGRGFAGLILDLNVKYSTKVEGLWKADREPSAKVEAPKPPPVETKSREESQAHFDKIASKQRDRDAALTVRLRSPGEIIAWALSHQNTVSAIIAGEIQLIPRS